MPNLPGYPSPPGNLNQVVYTFTGPASYNTMVPGTPPTGGIIITAQQLGLTSIHWAEGGCSDDGSVSLEPIFDGNPNTDVQQVRFIAVGSSTGTQTSNNANLSVRTFRIFAFGY